VGAAWYIVLSVSCLTLVAIAEHSQPRLFERFVGATSAMLVAVAVCAAGAACLSILTRRHGFYVARPPVRRGLARASGLAMLFGLIVIPADLVLRHPADMNVPYPASVLFYPVIAFMAESLFHLLPLCLLLSVLTGALRWGASTAIWASLVVVATLEPAFQVWTALSGTPVVGMAPPASLRVASFDGAHVLAINGAQVALFKRYDFLSMLWLRLIYYGIWHIAWGHLRLTC
jgi:hypothetical protein